MKQSILIIITGAPCTGKTELAKILSTKTGIPYFSRDDLKESLFDTLGIQDREWSKKLGAASYSLLFLILQKVLKAGDSVIAESNFNPKFASETFRKFENIENYRILQIVLNTSDEVLLKRFKFRANNGERHPGHVDHNNSEELSNILKTTNFSGLEIESEIINIQTDDFSAINIEEITHTIYKLRNCT